MAIQFGKAGYSGRRLATKRFTIISAFFVIFALIGSLFLILALYFYFDRHSLIGTYLCGIVGVGSYISIGVILLDRKEQHFINEIIDRAFRGAKAEETISNILSQLSDDYVVFHDVLCPMGNIDHIVVGPTGVFVIETKSHTGTITVNDQGTLLRNGRTLEKDFFNQVLRQSIWLKEQLKDCFSSPLNVNSTVVFTRATVQVFQPVRQVSILHKKWLIKHVTGKPRTFDSVDVHNIKRKIKALMGYDELNRKTRF